MSLDIASLFLLTRKELTGHLMRIVRCQETAHDLLQDCYLILTRTAAAQVVEQPRAFLYRTATNLALDHLRHAKVCERHTLETASNADHQAAFSPSAEHVMLANERLARFSSAVAALPDLTQAVFYLTKFEGLSYRDAARRLDVSERQVERHLLKAMLHCRQALD